MKFSDITACLRIVVLGMICVVMSACSAESVSVTTPSAENVTQQNEPAVEMESQNVSQSDTVELVDDTDHFAVPAQAFFRTLLSLNKNVSGGGNLNFHMPAIWIFSSQGDLVRIVQDEQVLATFQSEFSAVDPHAPSMGCQSIEQAVANITKKTWSMGCADGKWVALLLNTTTECERVCMAYKNVLAQVEQEHQTELQVRTLLVDMGS